MNVSAARASIAAGGRTGGARLKRCVCKTAAVLVSLGLLQACASSSLGTGANLSSDEKAAQANLNLGAAYLREGKPQLAVAKLQRALDQDSRLAEAHSALALAYDQLGQEDDAAKHYRRAAQLAPDDPAVANSYAVFLCRQHRWREAEPYFKRAADNPSYTTPAAALTNAGTCALSAGKQDSAEAYYRAALEKNGDYADALAGLMRLYYTEQNYLEARAFMQRYLDVRPATAPVLWLCFNLETRLKDTAAAQRCADRLQQDFPASAEFAQLRRLERDAQQ